MTQTLNPRNKLRSASINSSSQVSDLLRKKVKGEEWLLCVLPDKKAAEAAALHNLAPARAAIKWHRHLVDVSGNHRLASGFVEPAARREADATLRLGVRQPAGALTGLRLEHTAIHPIELVSAASAS